jgi:NADPH-dependent 2,4-dienoyl-CoA reductase/sulfur reductase-like enzyme
VTAVKAHDHGPYGGRVPRRLVVIGGDAGGMAAISAARQEQADLEVIALERGAHTSYSACGIPYVVSGAVADPDRLVVRTPDQHRANDIDVRIGHEAVELDVDAGTVTVRTGDGSYDLGYDALLLGMGGEPIRPPLPGIDLPFIRGVQTLDDGEALLAYASTHPCERVVVVGGGYIGLEMAEAFVQRGQRVTVLEQGPQVMGTLDPELGALVGAAMERHGIDVRVGTEVTAFEPGSVVTAAGAVAADLVVLGIGVRPNSRLAAAAGLTLGAKDAVRVDRRQRTSAEGVWAAGDCCESRHMVTGEGVHIALGTIANKQSRVAGTNIGGGYATFAGVVGTAISKICDTEVSRTGLSSREAGRAGFSAVAVTVQGTTRAGYFPGAEPMTLRLVVERGGGRLLGAQIVGGDGAAMRINACAVAITAAMTVAQVAQLDLAYAPPFSSVWDPILVAARDALKTI